MKPIRLLFLIASISAIQACGNQSSTQQQGKIDEKLFYPAFSFINQELSRIDSSDVALFTYRWNGLTVDTSLTEKAAFRQYVESVFTPEMLLEPSRFAFQKRVFMDETIGRVTISMDAIDPEATVRRMDVLMDPETEVIKSIYTEQVFINGDSLIQKRLTWLAGQQLSAGITNIIRQDTIESRLKIVWGIPQ